MTRKVHADWAGSDIRSTQGVSIGCACVRGLVGVYWFGVYFVRVKDFNGIIHRVSH